MSILADKGDYNLIETDTDWVITNKADGHEVKRYSKAKNPKYPIAAVVKWGYKTVDDKRMNEIMAANPA